MVFSSVIFLFYFLPVVLVGNLLLPAKARNYWLLACSLFFYAWAEIYFTLVILASIFANYIFGRMVGTAELDRTRRIAVGLAIAINLLLLGTFKYANFIIDNLNVLLASAGLGTLDVDPIRLPIGISFFTFQAMSYVIDIYRGERPAQRNPLNLALYISLFPQLVAGPIVRYHDIAAELVSRRVTRSDFASGAERFIVGLGKKVLIANTVALPADLIFALPAEELTFGLTWLAVVCYTLQIYFDFSGYSDMAIGLGRMLGFHFLENFNYPYVARSIQDFWRRWHISLSTWFRDYLYIPLGGNRLGTSRTFMNLVTVFFLCGLWHGAAWNFVVWGLFHGAFLVLERTPFKRIVGWLPAPARHAYTLLVVMVGWVFFRAESFPDALAMLQAMAGLAPSDGSIHSIDRYVDRQVLLVLVLGCIGATPIVPRIGAWLERLGGVGPVAARVGKLGACTMILLLCTMYLSAQTHNPFIYFRF